MLGYQGFFFLYLVWVNTKLFFNGEEDVRLAVQAASDRRLGRGEDLCAVPLL